MSKIIVTISENFAEYEAEGIFQFDISEVSEEMFDYIIKLTYDGDEDFDIEELDFDPEDDSQDSEDSPYSFIAADWDEEQARQYVVTLVQMMKEDGKEVELKILG